MMEQIKNFAPRKDKIGWCLQQFHDLLHIVRDIENYGSPNNIDAAPNDNILLILQKDLAEELIKKRDIFSQVSKRLHETDLIRKANKSLLRYCKQRNGFWSLCG